MPKVRKKYLYLCVAMTPSDRDIERAAQITHRYVLPYGFSSQEMVLAIATALAEERERCCQIVINESNSASGTFKTCVEKIRGVE